MPSGKSHDTNASVNAYGSFEHARRQHDSLNTGYDFNTNISDNRKEKRGINRGTSNSLGGPNPSIYSTRKGKLLDSMVKTNEKYKQDAMRRLSKKELLPTTSGGKKIKPPIIKFDSLPKTSDDKMVNYVFQLDACGGNSLPLTTRPSILGDVEIFLTTKGAVGSI